jgi:hypothetical protein
VYLMFRPRQASARFSQAGLPALVYTSDFDIWVVSVQKVMKAIHASVHTLSMSMLLST